MKAWIYSIIIRVQAYKYAKALQYVMKHKTKKLPIIKSDFSCVEFFDCDFSQAIFNNCIFHGVDFKNSNLAYSDLSKAITKRIKHNWVESNVHKDKLLKVLNNDITSLVYISRLIQDKQFDDAIREIDFVVRERADLKESQVYFR